MKAAIIVLVVSLCALLTVLTLYIMARFVYKLLRLLFPRKFPPLPVERSADEI